VHTYINHIDVDALTICPAGIDVFGPKLVLLRQNDFWRPTDAVVICGVHVRRNGNFTLYGLEREVSGAVVAGTLGAVVVGTCTRSFWCSCWGLETTQIVIDVDTYTCVNTCV